MGVNVTLRKKPISKNRQSLYLDFYPPIQQAGEGKTTRREFLRLYLFDNPKTSQDKDHNKEVLIEAREIRNKRHRELNNPEIYSALERQVLERQERQQRSFLEYFICLREKKTGSSYNVWNTTYKYLHKFSGASLTFGQIDKRFCNDFSDFLLIAKGLRHSKYRISINSAASYFNKFKAALRQAFKDGLIQYDISGQVGSIKPEEKEIAYLTLEELNILANKSCRFPVLKRAALFSALTGMAFKEIQNLTWRMIQRSDEYGYYIPHKRQKTKSNNYLPISKQAFELLGDRRDPELFVFSGLCDRHRYYYFAKWLQSAGINKPEFTFHGLRSTFATLQLSLGTDLFTVSKMLGHRNIKTTQVYADVINKSKREAADKIRLDI